MLSGLMGTFQKKILNGIYCKGVINGVMDVMIRRGKPRKSCPKAFVFSEKGILYISNNPDTTVFENDWSFLQPKVQYLQPNILKPTFAEKIEVKFESYARTIADKARIDFLEKILNIMLWK